MGKLLLIKCQKRSSSAINKKYDDIVEMEYKQKELYAEELANGGMDEDVTAACCRLQDELIRLCQEYRETGKLSDIRGGGAGDE